MDSSKVGRFLPFQWMTLQASGSHENWLMAEKAAEFRPLWTGGVARPHTVKNKSRQLALTADG
jgi:hypothetical protein